MAAKCCNKAPESCRNTVQGGRERTASMSVSGMSFGQEGQGISCVKANGVKAWLKV